MRLQCFMAGLLALAILGVALVCPAGEIYRLADGYIQLRDTGDAVQGASVYFYEPNSTTSTITAYTDLAHTTAVSWPLKTDADGYYSCYIAPGTRYDRYVYHAGWNVAQTTGHYLVGEPDTLEFDVGRIDTLKPTTGRTVYGRAASGKDAGILDYARVDVDTLLADTLYMLAADGEDSGAINVSLVYPDTIKARLGTALHVRADDGQNDADLNVYDVSATNEVDGALADFTVGELDTLKPGSGENLYVRAADGQNDGVLHVYELQACLVYADTAKCGLDTTFYIRSDDGQDDTLLDVAYIGGVTAATVETVYVTGQIQGGTRDYFYLWVGGSSIAEGAYDWAQTYDSNGQDPATQIAGTYAGEYYGVPLIRDGSITGVAWQFYVEGGGDALDAGDSSFIRVFVNGDSVYYTTALIDTSGIHGSFPVFTATQAAGISTFSAGDILVAKWGQIEDATGATTFANPAMRIEVQYDD